MPGWTGAMDEAQLTAHLDAPQGLEAVYPGLTVLNHEWWSRETVVSLGTTGADRVAEISGGLLHESVGVRLNRAVVEHDVALVSVRSSRTRWSASPAATSTSFPVSPGRR